MPRRDSARKGRGTPSVGNDEVVAFRVNAHNLRQRLSEQGMLDAARACGVQNSPPGSALVALHARVSDMRCDRGGADPPPDVVYARRHSSFRRVDAAVFTTGVLPEDGEFAL